MSSLTPTTGAFDPTYPALPVLTSFGIVFILLPAYWHFKTGNVGTMLYIVWTFIGNLIYFVNSIAWKGNLHNPPWFWCDLSAALIVALNVALPTSSLLITHRLYSIATIRRVIISKSDSRRTKYFEFAFGIGLPVLAVILHVVVQGHRFDIIENVGCWPSTYVTPVAIPLLFLPPILINLVSAVYASLAIRAFLKQRKEFSSVLASSNSGLTIRRYFRLMALAATEIICSLPSTIYLMVTSIERGIHPWISWADTHYDFNRVEFFPISLVKSDPKGWILVNLSRFLLPVGSFLFFIYLGMSGEPGAFYRRHFWRLAGVFGFSAPSQKSPGTYASWTSRPRTATAVSVPLSSTKDKETSSMDSLSRPCSLSAGFDGKKGSGGEHTLPLQVSVDTHSSIV